MVVQAAPGGGLKVQSAGFMLAAVFPKKNREQGRFHCKTKERADLVAVMSIYSCAAESSLCYYKNAIRKVPGIPGRLHIPVAQEDLICSRLEKGCFERMKEGKMNYLGSK